MDDNWLALLAIDVAVAFGNTDDPQSVITIKCRSWVELESQSGPIRSVTIDSATVESVKTTKEGSADAVL